MQPPKLEKTVTSNGVRWRVCYLGMCREFQKDWAATAFYEHVCDCYVTELASKKHS